jgi:hypothetical protein
VLPIVAFLRQNDLTEELSVYSLLLGRLYEVAERFKKSEAGWILNIPFKEFKNLSFFQFQVLSFQHRHTIVKRPRIAVMISEADDGIHLGLINVFKLEGNVQSTDPKRSVLLLGGLI